MLVMNEIVNQNAIISVSIRILLLFFISVVVIR
jgi:hypothetical protein